jgi:hypothetical protein
MARPRLIFNPADYSNFAQAWVLPVAEQQFEMIAFDPAEIRAGDILFTTYQTARSCDPWYKPFKESGHKLIIEHLVDSDVDTPSTCVDGDLILRNGSWMWYREALNYTWVGYNNYRPARRIDRSFLLLMNKQREHRDRILEDLKPLLSGALYSYVDRGHAIADEDVRDASRDNIYWLWYFNPAWYDRTAFSVVAESWMRSDAWFAWPEFPNYRTEVSEKIYKPMAYSHPLIVYGSEGTLRYLKRNGFETFSNLWDESYDNITSDKERFQAVSKTVYQAVTDHSHGKWDHLTENKLKHNAQRFWDLDLVTERFHAEITRDIMEFIS